MTKPINPLATDNNCFDSVENAVSAGCSIDASNKCSPLLGRPSKQDCDAIRNGQDVEGQEEMDVLYFDVVIELTLDEEGNHNGALTRLIVEVREELLPGCTDSLSQRRLGHARGDNQDILQKSRQLEETQ